MTSPVMTASSPCDEIRTVKCPGVCPGADSSQTSSVIWWRSSTSSDIPSAITGRTESSIGSFRNESSTREKKSHSVPPIRYFALGKVATHLPSLSIVFQPTWSTCRCVQTTRSAAGWCRPTGLPTRRRERCGRRPPSTCSRLASSLDTPPAVHGEADAGQELRLVGGEEEHGGRHVARLGEPPEGDGRDELP